MGAGTLLAHRRRMQRFTKLRWLRVLSVTMALGGCNALSDPDTRAQDSPLEVALEASTAAAEEPRGAAPEQADASDAELAEDDADGARADIDAADEDGAVDEAQVDPALE